MSMDPLIGTVRATAFNFAEVGWLMCDGSLVSIQQYSALFSLLGTTYCGDGRTTFGLPDLRGRAVAGPNPNGSPTGLMINQGAMIGTETVALTTPQMPIHTHVVNRKASASSADKTSIVSPSASLGSIAGVKPDGTREAIPSSDNEIPPNPPLVLDAVFSLLAVSPAGQGMPHENRQPFLALNFQIAYQGTYPSRP